MVAVDTATREVYGALMFQKTVGNVTDAFQEMIGAGDSTQPKVPQVLDTDQEQAWTHSELWRQFLVERKINQRFKTDKAGVNNLAMVDNRVRFVSEYIRKRMTEEGEDPPHRAWGTWFDEAIAAANSKLYKQALHTAKPEELYHGDEEGEIAGLVQGMVDEDGEELADTLMTH